ncbi:30S ribosomal protein S8 [Mycoplasma sp. SG1]|uniref:30S ribosomal protein S8 n=1 Tax=Mycoplasma sp. SG1 TaxID=2810348 RepID=UPI0020241FC0|nr:30S ribosomal protein S8 [Mycoplasma sp. SG1]URM52904.1 30S ribosomal protein S8 [Mycoplasma sp. SG1]
MVNHQIADLLVRIRNAYLVNKHSVFIPYSKMKEKIVKILYLEKYIDDYRVVKKITNTNNKSKTAKFKSIQIKLGYYKDKSIIVGIKLISKPGLRVYAPYRNIPTVHSGLGTVVLSTSLGILTDKQAKIKGVGGEVLFNIW